ncbi:MAG: hypothetical protein AAGF53_19265, partial [Pseudomonadota bacterium]
EQSMSDYDQWRHTRGYRTVNNDTGGAGLFWLLVVVAAMGALVFAGSLSNTGVPIDDGASISQPLVVPEQNAESTAPAAAAATIE